jgi:glycosyltransferase involved in cell wall biosynthesis
VSVIVPAYNAARELSALLSALSRQTAARESFEIIVADDCSTDETAARAADCGANVVQTPSRGGSYAARNAALRQARGGLLAFTDADCIPADDWIERGLSALGASGSGVVAGRIEFDLGDRPRLAALVDCSRFLDQESHVADGYGATANLWVDRRVMDRVGQFNPRLVSGGDADWGLRALAAGARPEFAPDLVVLHQCRDRFRQLSKKAHRLGRGFAQLARFGDDPVRSEIRSRWNDPRFYKPRRTLPGFRRIRDHGYRITPGRRVAILAAEYAFVRLPMAFGELRESRSLDAARGPGD